jgi:hypothetical protein
MQLKEFQMQPLSKEQQQIVLNIQREIDYNLYKAQEAKERLNLVFATLGIKSLTMNLVAEEIPETVPKKQGE